MTQRDLFVVVADLDAENTIKTLFRERQAALGIQLNFNPDRPPVGDLLRYSGRDSGCYKDASDVLRAPLNKHRHALLLFDRHGSGADQQSREEIECEVEERLCRNGWEKGKACVIVIEPELEAWIWAGSRVVADSLGWMNEHEELQSFLIENQLWKAGGSKPIDPKEAMRRALREKKKPSGAPLFVELAKRVSLQDCEDPAFRKFRSQLQQWFSP